LTEGVILNRLTAELQTLFRGERGNADYEI
jgi:hypothetical protein